MACYHPNKAFVVGLNENGKKRLVFTSRAIDYLWSFSPEFNEINRARGKVPDTLEIYNEFLLVDKTSKYSTRYYAVEPLMIPCGQCAGCRIDRSREWANRMVMESSYYSDNCFITLTYNEEHIPRSKYVDLNGVEREAYTLSKKDFQDFMKRLRKKVSVFDDDGKIIESTKVRFYACGEYGSETLRPHYHAIIFNWMPPDLRLYSHDRRGYDLYNSDILNSLWSDDKGYLIGHAVVSFVNWQTCAYTARYVTKKLGSSNYEASKYFNIEPEFCLMSRKPGLARRFFEDHKSDIYSLDKTPIIEFSTINGGLSFKPPRYFDTLYEVEEPEISKELKENRIRIAQELQELKMTKTDLDYFELLAVEEANFKSRIKALKRSL